MFLVNLVISFGIVCGMVRVMGQLADHSVDFVIVHTFRCIFLDVALNPIH